MASRVLVLLSLAALCLAVLAQGLPSKHKGECKADPDCIKICASKHAAGAGHCDPAKKHCVCDKPGAGGKHKGKSGSTPALHGKAADHVTTTTTPAAAADAPHDLGAGSQPGPGAPAPAPDQPGADGPSSSPTPAQDTGATDTPTPAPSSGGDATSPAADTTSPAADTTPAP